MDIDRDKLEAIIRLFDEAEAKVKEVEQLSSDLSIPSINELRYVGYHLTKALCQQTDDTISSDLDKAERHCKRAIYDAVEIGVIYLLEKIQEFQQDYGHRVEIITVIPNYIDLCANAHDTREFISHIKENCEKDRDRYYKECQPHYITLKDIYRKLDLARPEINKHITENNRSDRKATRRFVVTVIIGLLALIISATIAYRIYNPNLPDTGPTKISPQTQEE